MAETIEAVAIGLVLAAMAVVDARRRIIPNELVVALLAVRAARLLLAVPTGAAGPLLVASLAGFLAVAAVLALLAGVSRLLRIADGLGGGDVKLFCALGACLGAGRALAVILGACVAGVALAAVMSARQGEKPSALRTFPFAPPTLVSYVLVTCHAALFGAL